MKKIAFISALLLALLLSLKSQAQVQAVAFEELDSLMSADARHTVVFISTDWCRYCKQMENLTFQDKVVSALLNEDFYFVRLDGEQKENIRFKGHDYRYKPTGANTGVHELAEILGTIAGELSYPALVILNPQFEIIFQYNSYLEPHELSRILKKVIDTSYSLSR